MSDSASLLEEYRPHLRGMLHCMQLLDQIQTVEAWMVEGHMEHCTYYVNHILDLLYNEKDNLDYGYSVWNRSLQDAFDPSGAAFDDASKRVILNSGQDCIAVTNLLTYTLGQADGLDNTENALFFYQAASGDVSILYSSRNDTALFKPATAVGPCSVQIAYQNYLTGNLEDIPMV